MAEARDVIEMLSLEGDQEIRENDTVREKADEPLRCWQSTDTLIEPSHVGH